MNISRKREPLILLFGDIFFFILALWLTLGIRHGELPSSDLFMSHLVPFLLLYAIWVVVFFIAGLYDRHTTIFQKKLPDTILKAQTVNVVIAALFFFTIPYYGISPKTTLFIYLVISSLLIIFWRLNLFVLLNLRRPQKAIVIGTGKEMNELIEEINSDFNSPLTCVFTVDLKKIPNPNDVQAAVLEYVAAKDVSTIIAQTKNKSLDILLPLFYNLSFLNKEFRVLDMGQVYENVFQRVPLSMVQYDWILEHISSDAGPLYEYAKRGMDVIISLLLLIPTLILYPLVFVAIKLEDSGPVTIVQERIGRNNRIIKIRKFRSMTGNDTGKNVLKSKQQVTRVGALMRKTRIDEFPQVWSVFRGSQSFVGPRPELPELAQLYAEKIPYYNTRYLVKPGLSGWAQIHHQQHPHHGKNLTETKVKLSYDLYYIKNRSLWLDLQIALRTITTLLSRVGA